MDDAIRVGRHRRNHRDASGVDQIQDRLWPDVCDVADQPDVHGFSIDERALTFRGEQASVLTGQTYGERPVLVDQPHQLSTDLPNQNHPHHSHGLGGGDPQARAELAFDSQPAEHA